MLGHQLCLDLVLLLGTTPVMLKAAWISSPNLVLVEVDCTAPTIIKAQRLSSTLTTALVLPVRILLKANVSLPNSTKFHHGHPLPTNYQEAQCWALYEKDKLQDRRTHMSFEKLDGMNLVEGCS
eukprot:TRINITY_DN66922_c4_g1_i7.p1 TRINITY_DN66922_c4_g1~~TRINITY_DN66922_c4_g1_i7.p1  ORF type:complete len:124 (+),score=8.72 TRINITY_DN66922_c4_g1_i7:444-815(+)